MSQLSEYSSALTLGAVVGTSAGLYAYRAATRAVAEMTEVDEDGVVPRVPPAYMTIGLGAATGLVVAARIGANPSLPAYLYLTAIAPALGIIDAVSRRLPNRLVLPSYPIAVALLGLGAWGQGDSAAFGRSLLAGAAVYAFLLAIALTAPSRSFGWADVKLGGLLGLFLGYQSWLTTWLGVMAAFGIASGYVVVRALVKRDRRSRVLPLGPALLLGTLIAVIAR